MIRPPAHSGLSQGTTSQAFAPPSSARVAEAPSLPALTPLYGLNGHTVINGMAPFAFKLAHYGRLTAYRDYPAAERMIGLFIDVSWLVG